MFKKVLFSFLLLAMGVWLVVDDLFSPFAPPTPTIQIPNFVGSVASQLASNETVALEIEYRYDSSVASGLVISQDPIGGSVRKYHAEAGPVCVKLTVSLGVETVTLPPLVGEDRRAAETRLRELGCVVETVYQSGAHPAGEVLFMEPRAETVIPKGSRVVLTVCAGTSEESVTVPNFYGMSRADALVQLWLARLSLAEVVEVESDLPVGTVVRQSLPAGTLVPSGTRMTIYVSRFLEE